MNETINNDDCYIFKSNSININLAVMLLLAIVTSIVPILLSSSTSILFQTSLSFYITVVIMFGLMIYYGYWGILLGGISFCICGYTLGLSPEQLFFNTLINTSQLFLIYISFVCITKIKILNNNIYTKGIFYLSLYNLALTLILLSYFILSIFSSFNIIHTLIILSTFLLIITIIKSAVNKDITLILFSIFIALLPSLACSYISAMISNIPSNNTVEYITQWTLSNFILLQTAGYFIFQIMFTKREYKQHILNEKIVDVNINSAIYYTGQIIWNIIVICIFISNKKTCDPYIFFLPWALGNVLFGSNLYFSIKPEIISGDQKFKWYENRVIVVEQNAKAIIAIITLLIPLTKAIIGYLSTQLLLLFAANIFCACLSVGLIWVPSNSIKFISLLQTLKTAFFLFSVSLLLLSALLIIFLGKSPVLSFALD